MSALDQTIAGFGGGSLLLALMVAVLLGLRHATDPDHLTAVATLIASEGERGRRDALRLGLAWGGGHALTLFAFGVPVLLAGETLPEGVQRAAEFAVGALIVMLAVRLLARREHRRAARLGRTPLAAFGIGLVHGIGGSAAVGVLLVGAVSRGGAGVFGLALFAAATASSMALVSTAFGHVLTHGRLAVRIESATPALGSVSLLFGAFYAAGAL